MTKHKVSPEAKRIAKHAGVKAHIVETLISAAAASLPDGESVTLTILGKGAPVNLTITQRG